MTAIHLDATAVRLQLPVFRLGPLRGALLLQVEGAASRAVRRRSATAHYRAAAATIDNHRTAALRHRPLGL